MTPREFEEVFKKHGPLVWSLIRNFGLRDLTTEDLFIEIWEAVWKSLPDFKRKARLSTWIGGIARNKCVDHLRKKRIRLPAASGLIEGLEASTSPGSGASHESPRERAIQNEVKKVIGSALEELSSVQKNIVKRWMMGFKYREIAEMLTAAGIRPVDGNYVGKQLFLAKTRIAGILKREGIEAAEDIWE